MKLITSKRSQIFTLKSIKRLIKIFSIVYLCFFVQHSLYSQYSQLDFEYLIPNDLISQSLQFTDENGINYEIVWPNGISRDGIIELVQGDIWTTVLFHPTLENTHHRKEIYANILYAIATMPAVNEEKLHAMVEVLKAVDVKFGSGLNLAQKFLGAYEVLGEMNLRYVKGVDEWRKILNKLKKFDREYIRSITQGNNFQMAQEALIGIKALMTIRDIVTRTVLINALATEEAIRRLDTLERCFRENPDEIPDDPIFMDAFSLAKERIKLDQQGWNAFARATQENAHSVSQITATIAIKALAHKAAVVIGAKMGVFVSLWAIPISVGIFDYFEMTGTMNSVKHALLAGIITRKMRNILLYYLTNLSTAPQEYVTVLNESARYSQYEFYLQMKETFSGPLVDISAFLWKDIAELKAYYGEREKQALQILMPPQDIRKKQEEYRAAIGLILDSSGSMSSNDPDNSRIYGGEIVLDQADSDWEIGIVEFDTTSKLVDSGGAKEQKLRGALREIDSEGGTNMQIGLEEAYNYLSTTSGEKKGAILLTDGEHNTPSSDFDYTKYVEIYAQKGWPVHTIGLTGSANELLLSKIAEMTGGKYFKAEQSRDMIYIFDLILSEFKLEGVLLSQEGTVKQNETKDFPFYSDKSDESLTGTITYSGSKLDFSLISPSGREFSHTDGAAGVDAIEGDVYKIIKVKVPEPGNWKARVYGIEVEGSEEPFKIKVSADTPIRIETREVKSSYNIFEPIRFKAEITGDIYKNSVQGSVKVTPPEGKTEEISLKRTMDIVYNKSGKPGVYYFDIKVKGKTKEGEPFMREAIQHVVVSSEGREFGVGEVIRSLGGYIEINLGEEVGLRPGKKIFVYITKEGAKQKIAEGFVLSVSIGKSMVELTRVWNTIPQKSHRVEIERETGKY